MKIKRYKKVNRYLNFYTNNFGFRQPYQILVDGTFCLAALNSQINIADNLPKYLQGELKLLTTPCAIIETENFGPKLHGALIILKQYPLHKCGHEGKPISGSKCFQAMVRGSNKKHYIVATQDRDLQNKLQSIPGVPVLYLRDKAPVLSAPSEASVSKSKENLSGRVGVLPTEKVVIDKLKKDSGLIDDEVQKLKKRKGPKGPNPLSCKKKKRKVQENVSGKVKDESVDGIKPKRKKIRIPKHVKELLVKNDS
ncbi:hypothetical protein Trydic_g12106 [Trypoxylus dichotomus]